MTFGLFFNAEGILFTDSSSRRTIQFGDSETEEKSRKLAEININNKSLRRDDKDIGKLNELMIIRKHKFN